MGLGGMEIGWMHQASCFSKGPFHAEVCSNIMLLRHTNIVSSFWTVLFCWGHEQLLRALEWFPARQMSSVPVFDTELGKWREDRVVPPMVLGLVSLTWRGLHSLSAFCDLQWTQDVYARQTYYQILFRLTFQFKSSCPKPLLPNLVLTLHIIQVCL